MLRLNKDEIKQAWLSCHKDSKGDVRPEQWYVVTEEDQAIADYGVHHAVEEISKFISKWCTSYRYGGAIVLQRELRKWLASQGVEIPK